jgi:hypothetical protein
MKRTPVTVKSDYGRIRNIVDIDATGLGAIIKNLDFGPPCQSSAIFYS